MSTIGEIERRTQNRVVGLFRDGLDYEYRGDLSKDENGNIIE
jgi:type I restriction enzyme R subunit